MKTTYNVRIWSLEIRRGKTGTSYRVRWKVDAEPFTRTYKTVALADSFRSELLAAARRGEAFDVRSGLPTSMLRATRTMSWYDFACSYVDMKWPDVSPGHRRTIADALVPITTAMLNSTSSIPGPTLRRALRAAFSTTSRRRADKPVAVESALHWVSRNTRPVGDLADLDVMRNIVNDIERKLDGTRAAPNTLQHRRMVMNNALSYAVERGLLDRNPFTALKMARRSGGSSQVDRRSVTNPMQARTLLRAVGEVGKPGPPLVAFFGLMYYAALRPEEAASIKKRNLSLPAAGWGELHLEKAAPEIGAEWTDSGRASEERGLKHRADGVGRTVPCPPALTELLHNHLNSYGTAHDGRLFRGARNGGRIGSTTYGRVWAKARSAVFTADVAAGPLAKRPYDLRHAAVSTWLNAGVEPTRVAAWAGHSVAVLLRVYAKCIDGGQSAALRRVEQALGANPGVGDGHA